VSRSAAREEPGCRLYLISPPRIEALAAFAAALREALAGGDVAAFQLRLKECSDDTIEAAVATLKPIVQGAGAAFILNDRPDLAARLDCDGVHIGREDAPYRQARAAVGPDRIVGVTCHDSRHLAMEAGEAGADYVAFGAFFPSDTKETTHRPSPDILTAWSTMTTVPCVAIGGITAENCAPLVKAGTDFIAVGRAVWAHEKGPRAAVAELNASIAAAAKV
jgi:thiamine-phosphate pyrophosphorylase